jgi:transcriptional regulator GlxA family with amidase domain
LYGEGLTIALLSACFQGRPQKENSGLSISQLRLVLDFIHEHLDLSVSVFQLARLVDLSSSQFARSLLSYREFIRGSHYEMYPLGEKAQIREH